jgi:excisionase family DNA binding protein
MTGRWVVEAEVRMSNRFLTENDVAELTKISLGTLRRWRLARKGPKFHKFGSLVRYEESDLEEWRKAQPVGGDTRRPPTASDGSDASAVLRRAG